MITNRNKTIKISSSPMNSRAAHLHKNPRKPKNSISTAKISKPNNKKSRCMSKKIRRKRKKRNLLRKIKKKPIPLKKTKKSKKTKRKRTKSKQVHTNLTKNLYNKSKNSSPTE